MFELVLTDGPDKESSGVDLGQAQLSDGALGEGDTSTIYLKNTGKTTAREILVTCSDPSVLISLEGTEWGSSVTHPSSLFPGETFTFKAKPVYTMEDKEGERDFRFDVSATSVG